MSKRRYCIVLITNDEGQRVSRDTYCEMNVVQYSVNNDLLNESVLQTQRVHPFPVRTRKLSSAVVTILYGRPCGKIAQCRHRVGERIKPFPNPEKMETAKTYF